MGEPFGFVAFRSRQQAMRLQGLLEREGVPCSIINTPHEVALGCGISVRFLIRDYDRVAAVCDRVRFDALVGIYRADYVNARLVCGPMRRMY